MFTMRTSIHGRRIGISSTSGIISGGDGLTPGNGSTIFGLAAQMWGPNMFTSIVGNTTIAVSTAPNYGITTITSGTSTAIVLELARPEQGVKKEIYIETSASEMHLGGTSTAITFASTIETANGSSVFFSKAILAGTVIRLTGASTARWVWTGSTTTITIG